MAWKQECAVHCSIGGRDGTQTSTRWMQASSHVVLSAKSQGATVFNRLGSYSSSRDGLGDVLSISMLSGWFIG